MRTPKRKVSSDGDVYYTVRYRNPPGGPQRALSFWGDQGLADATHFCKLLAEGGPEMAAAWWNARLDAEENDVVTLNEWWARYNESRTGVTDGTRDNGDRIYRQVWKAPLGSKPLDTITREDISKVINEWAKKRSDTTIRNYYVTLAQCLRVAVTDGLLPRTPGRVRLPRRTDHEASEMRFLTHDEWDRVYDALPRHYRPLFTFLVGTGCRSGEAEALNVADVNLDQSPVVRVTKALKWETNTANRKTGPTKTRRSRRTVTLPPEVVAELEPLVDGRPGDAPLFTSERGNRLQHRKVWEVWKEAAEKAGIEPRPRVHDLRHTHVAWLLAAGVPMQVIQRRMGHEKITTTIDVYGHIAPEQELLAAEAASLAMRPRQLTSPPGKSGHLVDE